MVDLRDAGVDHRLGVARNGHLTLEDLLDELLDERLAAFFAGGVGAHFALFDDLVEQAEFEGLFLG